MDAKVTVVVRVYGSVQDRLSELNPLAEMEVCSAEELDAVVVHFSSPARYLTFIKREDTEVGTRDAARALLPSLAVGTSVTVRAYRTIAERDAAILNDAGGITVTEALEPAGLQGKPELPLGYKWLAYLGDNGQRLTSYEAALVYLGARPVSRGMRTTYVFAGARY